MARARRHGLAQTLLPMLRDGRARAHPARDREAGRRGGHGGGRLRGRHPRARRVRGPGGAQPRDGCAARHGRRAHRPARRDRDLPARVPAREPAAQHRRLHRVPRRPWRGTHPRAVPGARLRGGRSAAGTASLGPRPVECVLESRQPLSLARDPDAECAALRLTAGEPLGRSWLGVPMLAGGGAIGAIVVQDFERPGRFTPQDVAVLGSSPRRRRRRSRPRGCWRTRATPTSSWPRLRAGCWSRSGCAP